MTTRLISTRSYSPQKNYVRLVENRLKNQSKDYVFHDWSKELIHCDNQNTGFLKFSKNKKITYRLKFNFLLQAIKIINLVRSAFPDLNIDIIKDKNYFLDVSGMRSHLGKRYKIGNLDTLSKKKISILILIYDQLIFGYFLKKYIHIKDKVLVFNGRVSPECMVKHYFQDVEYFEQGIDEDVYLSSVKPVSIERFTKMVTHSSAISRQYVTNKKCDLLVSIFLTSPYEYIFAGKDYLCEEGMFQNQQEALYKALIICKNYNAKVLLKFHPYAREKAFMNEYISSALISLLNENFIERVTDPANVIIEKSDIVIVSSSSVALEAAIKNKPVLNMLKAFYQDLGISEYCGNEDCIKRFFSNPFIIKGGAERALSLNKKLETVRYDPKFKEKMNIARVFKFLILRH